MLYELDHVYVSFCMTDVICLFDIKRQSCVI